MTVSDLVSVPLKCSFISDVAEFQQGLYTDDALLWDRAGHWAQIEDNWNEAEIQFRKAYDLEPERYGYCLGTALNHLKHHQDALPILLEQANTHQPDSLSWFQVAIAQEGVGDYDGCEKSYERALELDPDYDLALFNLGGVMWNHGSKVEGVRVWREALKRFPSHPLAEKLRQQLSDVITS